MRSNQIYYRQFQFFTLFLFEDPIVIFPYFVYWIIICKSIRHLFHIPEAFTGKVLKDKTGRIDEK